MVHIFERMAEYRYEQLMFRNDKSTGLGVFEGIRACVEGVRGSDFLEGISVAMQGLGHVGYHLCRLLHEVGHD